MGKTYKFIIIVLLFVLIPFFAYSEGLTILKSVVPDVGGEGDTVTVCLTIQPEPLTSSAKADIMWVIDISGSMDTGINRIINNITNLTAELNSRGIDYRNGVLTYEGSYTNPAYTFHNYGFAADDAAFVADLASIVTRGGTEPGLHALYEANVGWRSDAAKTMVLITDENTMCSELDPSYPLSMTDTAVDLYSQGVVIHSISEDTDPSSDYPPNTRCNTRDIVMMPGALWLSYTAPESDWQQFLTVLGTNIGDYFNVQVRDPMPPELSPIGDVCGATVSGNELIWDITAIRSNQDAVVCCFGATITAAFAGSISNTAYVSADGVSETASDIEYVWYPTVTSTITITQTATITRTHTNSPTPTITQTITQTHTFSPTITVTSTYTPTLTVTQTVTASTTASVTPTCTPTIVPQNLTWVGPFPHPARQDTNVLFTLAKDGLTEICAFTVSGENVLCDEMYGTAGRNSWYWDLKNKSDKKVASGVYIIRIRTNDPVYDHESTVWGKVSVVK